MVGNKRSAMRLSRPPVLASRTRARASEANPSSVDAGIINPRQLSPSMGDYGMDDRDIDGEHDVLQDVAPATNGPVVDGVAAGEDGPASPVTPLTDGKNNSRAECWKDMTKEVTENGVVHYFAVCNYCKCELTAGSGAGTGHLNRHYKACLVRLGQPRGGVCKHNSILLLMVQ